MANGLDANNDLSDYAGHLKQEGYAWVGRYINPGKSEPLTHAEAQKLSQAGLYIVSIWEQGSPTQVGYFNTAAGTHAGNGAVSAAKSIGQPLAFPIYFAVDYDAVESDLTAMGDYFAALRVPVRAAGYFVGVYGSGLVCEYLSDKGYVSHTWLAQSRGWAGYASWKPHASIVQGGETTVLGLDVDLDQSGGNAGGWQIKAG